MSEAKKEIGSGLEERGDAISSREEEEARRMANHYGYASDEERRRKRGLEDWEMVNDIPTAQKPVPKWFIAVIACVIFVSISLSFPFFGRRADLAFNWSHWSMGVIGAVVWIIIGSAFIYFMTRIYGSKTGGRLDNDTKHDSE